MKILKFIFIQIILVTLVIQNINSSITNKIIAKVGNEIITQLELENKIITSLVLSGQEINQKNINQIKNLSFKKLIDLKLKKDELKNYEIKINALAIENHMKNISKRLKIENNLLKNFFKTKMIDYETYKNEVEIEFMWQKLINTIYSSKVNIDEKEIDTEINDIIKKKEQILEYKLAEIEIVYDEISRPELVKEIKESIKEIGFSETAVKYSISPTSLNGGEIGWVNSNSISNNLLKEVKNLKKGEVTTGIINRDNLIFFKMVDKRIKEINNDLNKSEIKKDIINKKKSELLNLYSSSHLSKKKNNTVIEIR